MYHSILLTIVVPAYNMENYLHRCMDSIIVESVMDRVQVLIVNDGSKDRTSEIAHEYEKRFPNYIEVIDKENGNYGSCMNVGLSLAKGKYFRTLDADDWYDSKAYKQFVDELEITDADMLVTERKGFHEDTGIHDVVLFDDIVPTGKDLKIEPTIWDLKSVVKMIHVSAVSYKTEILRTVNLIWDTNVFYSDNEFLLWPLCQVKSIRILRIPIYIYVSGRAGQSVDPRNINKNWHSWAVISKNLLGQVLKPDYRQCVNYPLIKRCLKVAVLPHFYRTLLYDGLKNKHEVDEVESFLKVDMDLYREVGKIEGFRGHYFIDEYRHCFTKYLITRGDYLLRTNRFLRKILKKYVRT